MENTEEQQEWISWIKLEETKKFISFLEKEKKISLEILLNLEDEKNYTKLRGGILKLIELIEILGDIDGYTRIA